MSLRISTRGMTEAGIETLQKRQVELAEAQERLTTGKRVHKARTAAPSKSMTSTPAPAPAPAK